MSGLLFPILVPFALFLLLIAVMLYAGRIFEVAGWARPLAEGDLRARLEALTSRAGLALAGILVRTGPGLNARVLGFTAGTQRVMLTEGLIQRFNPQEVEAVFAHEIGHIRQGHFRWLLIMVTTFLLLTRPFEAATRPLPAWIGMPLALAAFLGAWLLVFGRVSRRFELEADLAAADLVGAGPCERALAQGEESGAGRASMRHPPIARRRANLLACAAGGPAREAFERSGRWLRRALLALLLAAAAAFAASLYLQSQH